MSPTTVSRFAALVVLSTAPAVPAEKEPSAEYQRAVTDYVAGDREPALAAVAGWDDARLSADVAALVRSRGVPTVQRRAALLLHTEAAFRERSHSRSPLRQTVAAQEIAKGLAGVVAEQPFIGRWYLALALDAQGRMALAEALDWAERGRRVSDIPDLRLVIASVEEVATSLAPAPAPDRLFDGQTEAWRPDLADASRKERLERVRSVLDDLLRADPGSAEAHLRLGRVLWRLGDLAEARVALRAAEASHPTPAQAYLARLFLGDVEADDGQLAAAAEAYAAAVAIQPDCQSARLALSRSRLEQGNGAAARGELQKALALAGRRAPDPYWLYPLGQSARFPALIDELRREAVR